MRTIKRCLGDIRPTARTAPVGVSFPPGMLNIPAFVINLDGSDRRLDEVRRECERMGLPFTRIPAVDGRKRPASSFPEYDSPRTISFLDRDLLGGEIACWLSHQHCLQAFLETGAPYGLVLEDDSVLHDGFRDDLEELLAFAAANPSFEWHVVHLASRGLKLTTPLRPLRTRRLYHAHYFPMRSTTLLWSRAGAQAFMASADRIFAPIDTYLRYWVTRTGRGLVVDPPMASDRGDVSEIGSGDEVVARQGGYRGIRYFLRKQRRIGLGKLAATRGLLARRLNPARFG